MSAEQPGVVPPIEKRFIEYRLRAFPTKRVAAWESAIAAHQEFQAGDHERANKLWRIAVMQDPGLSFLARPEHIVGEDLLTTMIRANTEFQSGIVEGMRRFMEPQKSKLVITPYNGGDPEWDREEREVDEDIRMGRVDSFPSIEEAIIYLMDLPRTNPQ